MLENSTRFSVDCYWAEKCYYEEKKKQINSFQESTFHEQQSEGDGTFQIRKISERFNFENDINFKSHIY